MSNLDEHERFYARLCEERGIEDICTSCNGTGRRTYGDSTTWRRGTGGQALTADVCDRCWGTGDQSRKGANLRLLSWRDDTVERRRDKGLVIGAFAKMLDLACRDEALTDDECNDVKAIVHDARQAFDRLVR